MPIKHSRKLKFDIVNILLRKIFLVLVIIIVHFTPAKDNKQGKLCFLRSDETQN